MQTNSSGGVALTRIYTLESRIELLKVLRQPGFTVPSLIFPVMFYLFFGVLFARGPDMPAYLLATYSTFGVMGPALFSFGLGVAIERGQGWYDLKEVFPMPFTAQIVSRVMTSLVFAMAIIILLFTVAATLGDVVLQRWQWLTITVILLFGVLPFCLIGLTLGLYLKANSAPAVVNLIYLPMAFLSGLWIPIQFFPDWMQTMAMVFPAYHLSQLTLMTIDMHEGQSILFHVGVMSAYIVVFALLAAKAFQRDH